MFVDNPCRTIGYHIHPTIAADLPPNPSIAEVATGTGIYLEQLSVQLAASRLDGFDISAAQFPTTTPSNIRLILHNAKEPFPPEYHAQYDLVYIKYLVCAMEPDDWELVARNCIQLLKPGGAIQWIEGAFHESKALPGLPAQSTKHFSKAVSAMLAAHSFRWEAASKLPGFLTNAGFVDVTREVVGTDRLPETRKDFSRVNFEGIAAWAWKMRELNAPGAWSAEQIEEMEENVRREIGEGVYLRSEFLVTMGRRSIA